MPIPGTIEKTRNATYKPSLCPEGYEYVKASYAKNGKYIRPYCRKKKSRWDSLIPKEAEAGFNGPIPYGKLKWKRK